MGFYVIPLIALSIAVGNSAFAFNLNGAPLSKNVEDRRPRIEVVLDPSVQEKLMEYGDPAAAGKFPFTCPALERVKDDSAKLAKGLSGAPTFLSLRENYEAEMSQYTSNEILGVDACEGAKQAQLDTYDAMIALIKKHREKLLAATRNLTDRIGQNIVFELSEDPSIIGWIRDVASKKCPQITKRYLKLVEEYRAQGKWSLDQLKRYEKRLTEYRRIANSTKCD